MNTGVWMIVRAPKRLFGLKNKIRKITMIQMRLSRLDIIGLMTVLAVVFASTDDDDNATYSKEQYQLHRLNSIIKDPSGWKKDRHISYPTTDLNLVTDPFTTEDRAYLAERLNARLAPVVERVFGIARGAIRANDVSIGLYCFGEVYVLRCVLKVYIYLSYKSLSPFLA